MTQRLPDMQMVGKVYAEMFRMTGHDWPARNAAIAAWRKRYPNVDEENADLAVAHLIVEAIDAGLVWGSTRPPDRREHVQSAHLERAHAPKKAQDNVRRAMTQTEKFIARLHYIAAGGDSLDRQVGAVAEVFARFLEEARQSLGEDRERMRSGLTGLQFELTKQALLPCDGHFADLCENARKLVKGWLQKDLR